MVHVTYHMFGVIDVAGEEVSFPVGRASRTNALVDVYEGAAIVATGIHTGVVAVTTEVRTEPPPAVDLDGWDEVVEVSVDVPGGHGRLAVLMDDVPATYPCLTPAGRGTYRLRARARGRDTAIDGVASEPFEHYLLALWPGPRAPQAIYKETDRYGAGWHAYDPAAPPLPPPARDEWRSSGRVAAGDPQPARKPPGWRRRAQRVLALGGGGLRAVDG